MIHRFALAVFVLVPLLPSLGVAQQQDSTPAARASAIMRASRASGSFAMAVTELRRPAASGAVDARDAIADSMVAEILNAPPGGDERTLLRANAVSALGQSAAASGQGTRYPGALQRLQRIAEESEGHGGGVPVYIAHYFDPEVAIPVLRRIARSASAMRAAGDEMAKGDPGAMGAISELAHHLGEAGLETLRLMYLANEVRSPGASLDLARLAHVHGWKRTPR